MPPISANDSSTQVSDANSVTGRLCNWIHSVTLDDFPPHVQERAAHLMLDGIGCALVGSHMPWSEIAVNAVLKFEPSGHCTVIGWDRKLSPTNAALLNSSFVQGFELDDFHSAAPLHSNSLLIPALLAAWQHNTFQEGSAKLTGADLLLAYMVGCEIGPRVGLSLFGIEILSRGWHSGAVFGGPAVAAAVGKLLALTPAQLEDAQGLACTQAGGLMAAQFGSMGKRMQHGFPSRNGLFSVLMAREGYTGIHNVFDQSYGGFFSCFGDQTRNPTCEPEEIVRELGQRFEIERIRVKAHATMGALQCPVDCVAALQQTHADTMKDTDRIEKIDIEMADEAYHHGGWKAEPGTPLTAMGAQMNVAYATAVQLLDGQVLIEQYTPERLGDSKVWDLMAKVNPIHNPTFDQSPTTKYKTKMTVAFNGGQKLEQTLQAARGTDPPLSNEEIVTKFRMLCQNVVSDEVMETVEKIMVGVKGVEDLGALFDVLGRTVDCPLKG